MRPHDKTTEELIQEIKQGLNVEENFRQLFEQCYDQVQRFFRYRKGISPEDSRELTQQTFLSVYKGLKGFRQESPFENWLFSIARNIWRNEMYRRSKRPDAISLDQEYETSDTDKHPPLAESIVDPAVGPLESTIEKEKLQWLHEAMEGLPEQQRRCLELRIIYDLSYKEIAVLTDKPINTVKAHLHEAKKNLGERLKAYFGEVEF